VTFYEAVIINEAENKCQYKNNNGPVVMSSRWWGGWGGTAPAPGTSAAARPGLNSSPVSITSINPKRKGGIVVQLIAYIGVGIIFTGMDHDQPESGFF